jgi:hypothetical protein
MTPILQSSGDRMWPISSLVNSPNNDDPSILEPATALRGAPCVWLSRLRPTPGLLVGVENPAGKARGCCPTARYRFLPTRPSEHERIVVKMLRG